MQVGLHGLHTSSLKQASSTNCTNSMQYFSILLTESTPPRKKSSISRFCKTPASRSVSVSIRTLFPSLLHSPLFLYVFSEHSLHSYPAPAVSSCMAEHCVSYCHASNAQVKPSDIYLPQGDGKRNRFSPK